jgi:hypothetical protein
VVAPPASSMLRPPHHQVIQHEMRGAWCDLCRHGLGFARRKAPRRGKLSAEEDSARQLHLAQTAENASITTFGRSASFAGLSAKALAQTGRLSKLRVAERRIKK